MQNNKPNNKEGAQVPEKQTNNNKQQTTKTTTNLPHSFHPHTHASRVNDCFVFAKCWMKISQTTTNARCW
jgi:hypothetical protein